LKGIVLEARPHECISYSVYYEIQKKNTVKQIDVIETGHLGD